MAKQTGDKGVMAEEALRGYFLSTGHFVVRGIPFMYVGYDVTDIDLWLYVKSSSTSRERACVDVKRKKTPQAMERVFWTRGLREVIGVERAIVVTTDNRAETRDFGLSHGVTILHGDFLQRVIKAFPPIDRLTEEEVLSNLNSPCVIDPSVQWRPWFRGLKSLLLNSLNFDGCNQLLLAIKLLVEEYLAAGGKSSGSTRLLYICSAYFLLCLDFTTRSIVHLEAPERKNALMEGFRYGQAGKQRTEEIVEMSLRLLEEAGKADLFSRSQLRSEFDRQVAEYPADVLSEYFAKPESLKRLFDLAREFHKQAYLRELIQPQSCSAELKSIIGLFCDFWSIDRKKIL